MSRVTKYLRQTCLYESAKTNTDGTPALDRFGERQYAQAIQVKCRAEGISKQILTAEGAIITSATRYYLDSTVPVKTEDRLDGHVVLHVATLVNGQGRSEGTECYV